LHPPEKQYDELAPHKHPFVNAVHPVFAVNKNPDEQATHQFETPVAVAIVVAIFEEIEAAAAQAAQLVAGVPHAEVWEKAK